MTILEDLRASLERYDRRGSKDLVRAEASECGKLDDRLAEGVRAYRLLCELEGEVQATLAEQPDERIGSIFDAFAIFYRLWVRISGEFLERAESVSMKGCLLEHLDDFRSTFEEASAMIDSLAMEAELPPTEELLTRARPGSPDPARYGD